MCHDGPHVCTPDPHMPVLPQGSALIPNVTPRPPRGRACYPRQLSRISRLAPHTNTSLFYALCPHSCAPGKDFPVGYPSPNRSGPSTLNPEFLWSEFPEKKLQLVDMSILSILLSPEPGCHNYSNYIGSRIRDLTPFYSYSRFPPSFGGVVASIDNFYS
jgi:hypothetical protein